MKIAHVGPPVARRGGAAGYLWQLSAVAGRRQSRAPHRLTFPEAERAVQPPSRSIASRARSGLGRMKRTLFGAPKLLRPSVAEMSRDHGIVDQSLRRSMQWTVNEASDSVRAAAGSDADVLFGHDPAVAEQLLALRRPDQQVWLMLHSPMPVPLYLTWSWGVPEWNWTDVANLPDVRRWMEAELEICGRADRVVVPCAEALDELARVDTRYSTLPHVDYVLTGAAAPGRQAHAAGRRELRKSFGLPDDIPIGLFLGTAQPYRGLGMLLDALRAIPQSVPGLIVVAGPSKDTIPVQPRVRTLGAVSRIGDLLAAVDFVVNVNQFSLFDLSIIEAAEAGCPMLLHAIGGNRRFTDLGVGAVILPNLAPASIAAGVAEMFAMSGPARDELGRRSRRCYEQHLTPDHLWDEHMRLYSRAGAPALSVAAGRDQ